MEAFYAFGSEVSIMPVTGHRMSVTKAASKSQKVVKSSGTFDQMYSERELQRVRDGALVNMQAHCT